MTRSNIIYTLLFCLALLGSCQPVNDKNVALLGRWEGTQWLINDEPSQQDPSKVYFEFNADGTYSAGYRTQGEKGIWRTHDDKLYTTAEGRKEMVVRFHLTDTSTLRFEMNRGGQPEIIELAKAK